MINKVFSEAEIHNAILSIADSLRRIADHFESGTYLSAEVGELKTYEPPELKLNLDNLTELINSFRACECCSGKTES